MGKWYGERKAAQSKRGINQISRGKTLENRANTQPRVIPAKGRES